jgi:type IV secretion system protein VirB2
LPSSPAAVPRAGSPNSPASKGSAGRRLPHHPRNPTAQERQHDPHHDARSPHAATAAAFTYINLVLVPAAHASGSSMPWEAPLQKILESIEGPVAKIVAVIIIIATGLTLAFGDTSGGFRRLIQIVFGLSIAFAVELLPVVLLVRRRGARLMAARSNNSTRCRASPSRSTGR